MKVPLFIVFVIGAIAMASYSVNGSNYERLKGTPYVVLFKFRDAALAGDGTGMYSLMSDVYKESIEEARFRALIEESEFVLVRMEILEERFFYSGGYVLVGIEFTERGRRVLAHKPIFISKVDQEWKIDSFPFPHVGIAEFPMIPAGLERGIYGRNESP